MRIYRIGPGEGVEWVQFPDLSFGDRMRALSWRRVADGWVPMPVRRITEDGGETFRDADMPWLGGRHMVLRESALAVLGPLLAQDVEFLPLAVDDGTPMWISHALRTLPVLDVERSEILYFRSGGIMRIARHAFLPSVAEAGLAFHLSVMPRTGLFLREHVKAAVEEAGLSGWKFHEVWRPE